MFEPSCMYRQDVFTSVFGQILSSLLRLDGKHLKACALGGLLLKMSPMLFVNTLPASLYLVEFTRRLILNSFRVRAGEKLPP